MARYLTLTSRARSRLLRNIFTQVASKVSDAHYDSLACEDHFAKIRSALNDLHHHERFGKDIADNFNEFYEAHTALLTSLDAHKLFSPEKKKLVQELADKIMSAGRTMLNPSFTEADISMFVQVCAVGREHFKREGYDQEEFIADKIVVLAILIAGNFAAYKETLNEPLVTTTI